MVTPTKELLEQHYADLTGKVIRAHNALNCKLTTPKFFPSLLSYMLSGPVVCMVWVGAGAVVTGRKMLGETNPQSQSSAIDVWL